MNKALFVCVVALVVVVDQVAVTEAVECNIDHGPNRLPAGVYIHGTADGGVLQKAEGTRAMLLWIHEGPNFQTLL